MITRRILILVPLLLCMLQAATLTASASTGSWVTLGSQMTSAHLGGGAAAAPCPSPNHDTCVYVVAGGGDILTAAGVYAARNPREGPRSVTSTTEEGTHMCVSLVRSPLLSRFDCLVGHAPDRSSIFGAPPCTR